MLSRFIASFIAAIMAAGAAPAMAFDDPRVGEEVDSICFGRSINGWRSLDGEDDVVLLERGVNNWYLVELSGGCDGRLFDFAQTIGIESRPAGGCVRRGDVIIVEDVGDFERRCFIRRIYEWNEDAGAEEEADDEGEYDDDEEYDDEEFDDEGDDGGDEGEDEGDEDR